MLRQLKHILLQIARLPMRDQRWIVARLTDEQRSALQRHQGLELLKNARRFKKLPAGNPTLPEAPVLPDFCSQLASEDPLYAAIVLAQGDFPWQAQFLQDCDHEGSIKNSLDCLVPDIKDLVKQALFDEWESRLSFDSHLESQHG